MNKDQKLIFEAYTETLTEGWEAGTSKAPKGKSFDMSRGGAPSNVNAARAVADHYENEESLVGKEAILDHNRPVMVIDHDGDKFVFVQDEDGDEFKVPLSRLDFTASSENEEVNLDNTPLEELSILTPEEFEMVQNFENFNPDEWGYNAIQKFYFRKRKGGESEETSSEDDNDQYAPDEAPADDQLGGLEPLDAEGDEAEEDSSRDIAKSLQEIVGELKTLNQYADFMTTGTRAQGFTGGVQKK